MAPRKGTSFRDFARIGQQFSLWLMPLPVWFLRARLKTLPWRLLFLDSLLYFFSNLLFEEFMLVVLLYVMNLLRGGPACFEPSLFETI
jgi:hypothetical protein